MIKLYKESVKKVLELNPFLAFVLYQMHVVFVDNSGRIKTAGVSLRNKQVNLFINKEFFSNLTLEGRAKILIHEAFHVTHYHLVNKNKVGTLWNIAMDCAINEYIKDIETDIKNCVTVSSLSKKLETPLESRREHDYYYEKIKEWRDSNPDKLKSSDDYIPGIEEMDDHSGWAEEGKEDEAENIIDDALNKAAKYASKIGKKDCIPLEVQKRLESKVNWRQELRKFAAYLLQEDKVLTKNKRHRRYGTLYPGEKRKPKVNIAVIIDVSGSCMDPVIQQMFRSEIDLIANAGADITVIQCDTEVTAISSFDSKKHWEFVGGGGTLYQPGLDKAVELKVNGIIYIGDMENFDNTQLTCKLPVIWANYVSKELPNNCNFGKAVNVA